MPIPDWDAHFIDNLMTLAPRLAYSAARLAGAGGAIRHG